MPFSPSSLLPINLKAFLLSEHSPYCNSLLPLHNIPFPHLAAILSNKDPPFLKSGFNFVTSKQHMGTAGGKGHCMAGLAPGQPPGPARVATPGFLNRAWSETVNRTGCQKSLSNFKNSTIFQFTVQFYGDRGGIKIMGQGEQESNHPDLFGLWFQGEWISGSRGSSSRMDVAFP